MEDERPDTQETQPAKDEPIEIPVPKRADWEKVLGRATGIGDKPDDDQRR